MTTSPPCSPSLFLGWHQAVHNEPGGAVTGRAAGVGTKPDLRGGGVRVRFGGNYSAAAAAGGTRCREAQASRPKTWCLAAAAKGLRALRTLQHYVRERGPSQLSRLGIYLCERERNGYARFCVVLRSKVGWNLAEGFGYERGFLVLWLLAEF